MIVLITSRDIKIYIGCPEYDCHTGRFRTSTVLKSQEVISLRPKTQISKDLPDTCVLIVIIVEESSIGSVALWKVAWCSRQQAQG